MPAADALMHEKVNMCLPKCNIVYLYGSVCARKICDRICDYSLSKFPSLTGHRI